MTVKELQSNGGKARARNMTPAERSEAAGKPFRQDGRNGKSKMRDLAQEFVDASNFLNEGYLLKMSAHTIEQRRQAYIRALRSLIEAYGGKYDKDEQAKTSPAP